MKKMLCFLLVITAAMAYLTSCKKESSINPTLNALGLKDTLTDTIPHHPTDSLPHDSVHCHPHDTIPHDTIPHFPHDTVPYPPYDTFPHNPIDTPFNPPVYPPVYPPIDSFPNHDSLSVRHG
ncbi:hypothetical protein SAMN05428988_3782 [Chitinophaga sp. YR573]|uniref:hypothetical protein n=1 Tax=Chitinophaga sp. YR573 TaxID=1881040 RepID=UPI0008AD7BF4|nr:hypothetical protein [Chitinophaga sp. YR573]SEW26645.1 hypothetical protein SAMN05428988_3782 [Chitinophaga sp. YR573]